MVEKPIAHRYLDIAFLKCWCLEPCLDAQDVDPAEYLYTRPYRSTTSPRALFIIIDPI